MSSYRQTMAEALEEVSLKSKLKVLDRKIKRYRDKVFKKTMSTIKSPLFAGDIEEGRMKDIFTADQEGKSAEEIAKIMKLSLKTVKSILGEDLDEASIKPYVSMQRDSKTGKMNYVVLDKDEKEAFRSTNQTVAQDYFKKNFNKLKEELYEKVSDKIIKDLQKAYSSLRGKTISPEMAMKMSKHLDQPSYDLGVLRQLVKANIPFVSGIARNKIYKKTGKFEEIEEQSSSEIMKKAKEFGVTAKMTPKGIDVSAFKSQDGMDKFMKYIASKGNNMINLAKVGMKRNFEAVEEPMPKEEPKKDNEKKESENKDNTIASLKDQIAMLKTKLENEKNKAIKPEPNPDTGEVPLTVGVAYKHFKDKKEKEEVKKEVNEATVVSDISGISIPALKRETAKFNIKVARVTPGGPNGAEYEVTFTGAEKDLIAYAKEHFGFDDKPGSFQQLKKHLNMDYVPEKAMSDKDKRIQRAKDMIKYYDAQKKAALKGKNKDLAKKMLKNDLEEADLTKSQIKQVHKVADDLPKKDFKDRYGKEKGDAVRFGTATNMVKKKLGMKEDRRLYVETIAGLKKKAEKSGMPYGILKKVYDRGMAAWKSGHRPGASQQQWAFARVNSFVTKSSGTWGGADKDLAKQVRGK